MNEKVKVSKHTTTIATYIFLVPLVFFIPSFFQNLIEMSKLTNIMLSVAVIVVLMSYLIMPTFTMLYTKLTNRLP